MADSASKDSDILKAAKDFYSRADDFESSFRSDCREAIRFVRHGEQWTQQAIQARQTPGQERIMLTFNRLREFNRQVINGIRQNTPSISVRPVGSGADEPTAEIYDGIIRQIQRHSKADTQYEEAASWAVDCGFGYLTVLPEFISDNSFDRIPVIRAVSDPFRVRFDPQSVQPDGSDATEAIVVDAMDRADFDRQYGATDKTVADFDGDAHSDAAAEWYGEDTVILADYFRIEYRKDQLWLLPDGSTVWASEQPEGAPIYPVKTRDVQRKSCVWYKLGGDRVFDRQDLGIPWVPVVPVYGDMWIFEGRKYVQGITQNSMDAARAYNYSRTTEVELISLARRRPRLAAQGAISGLEHLWAGSANTNPVYLPFHAYDDQDRPLPAPTQDDFPSVPAALVQLSAQALDDLKATAGIPDPGRGESEGANQSGRAVAKLQAQAAQGTSHFAMNLGRSVEHAGRLIVGFIPKLYITEQVIHILKEDDTQRAVRINPNQPNASQEYQTAAGNIEKAFRLDVGEYNVVVKVGPTYGTRKQEAADTLLNLGQAFPQAMQPAAPKIIRYLDIPGGDDIADAVERGMPPELREPKEGEMSPEVMAAQAQIQQLQQQLQAATQQVQQLQAEQGIKGADVEIKRIQLEKERLELEAKREEIMLRRAAPAPKASASDPRAARRAEMDHDAAEMDVLMKILANQQQLIAMEQAEAMRETGEAEPGETAPARNPRASGGNPDIIQHMRTIAEALAAPTVEAIRGTQPVRVIPQRDDAGNLIGAVREMADGSQQPVSVTSEIQQ